MRRPLPLVLLAAVAAVESAAFLAYAATTAVAGIAAGAPLQGLVVETAVFAAFAAGLAAAARGWWHAQRWARSLHVLAQLLVLVVAAPSLQSIDAPQRIAGLIGIALAAPTLILAMTPAVTRAIVPEDERPH